MGDGEETGDPRPDDPFRQLLEPGFQAAPAQHEPSAEERARAAERARRAADLERRLREEHEHLAQLEQRDRRTARRSSGRQRLARVAGPVLVISVVVGASLIWWRQDGESAAPQFDGPPPGVDAADEPLGSPPPLPAGDGPSEFLFTQPGGDDPVAFDPCRPVRYVVNPDGAPAGSDALVEEAVARTAAATGLRFEPAGTTDEVWSKDRDPYQPGRYGERWAPVLIAWSDESEVPALGGYVAGIGGPQAVPAEDGRSVFVTGAAMLDAGDLGPAMAVPAGVDAVRAVIQHELGHVVGLDHVADPTQLMYTEGSPAQTSDWGDGDLRGLRALGSGDCFPGV